MIKHIFFDFNGTIIDDVDLCIDLLNEMLNNQGKKSISKEEYKMVFKFPIKQYYLDAGISFEKESFEALSQWFIERYQPESFKCGLYEGAVDTFSNLQNEGYNLYILSASEKNNLREQTDVYKITKYFKDILGTDNILAATKVDIAKQYIKKNQLNCDEILFIGDTLHDVEVATAIGARPVLVSCGHQSIEVLKQANVTILPSICDIWGILK